ncbi:type II secretion system protein GspM [Endozoicomonas ascidiicola]|uniref:type II secretion system protein GspM n=1 Tax=Endozoicomonas ascidiicola TaxID=1698521 RepID=UPI00082A4EB6|nr:type II secretion system protein M [Endozoicomonas ascidiicola]
MNIQYALRSNRFVDKLLQSYRRLPIRDQKALLMLTAFLSVAMLYLLIWEPVYRWQSQTELIYLEQRNTYRWMQENIETAKASRLSAATKQPTESLSSRVSKAASEAGLSVSRIRPDDEELRVWIEVATYQQLIPWLQSVEQHHNMTIEQAQISEGDVAGQLNVFLRMR